MARGREGEGGGLTIDCLCENRFGELLGGSTTSTSGNKTIPLPSETIRNQLLDLYFNQIVHPNFPMLVRSHGFLSLSQSNTPSLTPTSRTNPTSSDGPPISQPTTPQHPLSLSQSDQNSTTLYSPWSYLISHQDQLLRFIQQMHSLKLVEDICLMR